MRTLWSSQRKIQQVAFLHSSCLHIPVLSCCLYSHQWWVGSGNICQSSYFAPNWFWSWFWYSNKNEPRAVSIQKNWIPDKKCSCFSICLFFLVVFCCSPREGTWRNYWQMKVFQLPKDCFGDGSSKNICNIASNKELKSMVPVNDSKFIEIVRELAFENKIFCFFQDFKSQISIKSCIS